MCASCRFLATGDSYTTTAHSYRLGTSTVAEIVHSTCCTSWDVLQPSLMPHPDESKWRQIALDFQSKWNFPFCCGAVDGKHVVLKAPPKSGSLFYNYKDTFSIVFMAVVDANYCFVVIDVGAYGRSNDGGVFSNSKFGVGLKCGQIRPPDNGTLPLVGEMPHVLVGRWGIPTQHVSDETLPRAWTYTGRKNL